MKDPYLVLGVAREASADDIKKAYRKLARKLHPDLNPNDKKAEERFKEISAAYDLLSDSEKRARFDRGEIDASGAEKPRWSYRQHADAGQGDKYSEAFSFGGSIDDILEQMLRRRGSGRTGPGGMGGEFRMRGQDANYVLKVGFVEATAGTTKRITLPTGKNLDVRIPPGTEDGQTLRLKGQGGAGMGGAEAGDALVEVRVEPHPFFTRKGDDVHVEVPVTLGEAVLGGKITVPTIDGRVSLTVPPNANSGTVLRLKGKGVPRGGHRGDQFVRLKVVLPERPDPDLAAFVRDWAEKHPYDVRGRAGMA